MTYMAVRDKSEDPNNFFNGIMWYNRISKEHKTRSFGFDNSVSEPVLIETPEGNYLIVIVYQSDVNKSFVYILDATTLEDIYVAEMPEVIPPGYHGRWDYDKIV